MHVCMYVIDRPEVYTGDGSAFCSDLGVTNY